MTCKFGLQLNFGASPRCSKSKADETLIIQVYGHLISFLLLELHMTQTLGFGHPNMSRGEYIPPPPQVGE